MSEAECRTCVLVGRYHAYQEKHKEVVLAIIYETVRAGVSHFSASIANPRYGPRLNVSVDRKRIQVTESTDGAKVCVLFSKRNNLWFFDSGPILTMKEGWVDALQGWDGSVIFDSSNILDQILQAGDRHDDKTDY